MKTCLFDIDGTLVMTGGAGQQAFAEAFAELFDVPEISQDVSFAGRSDRAIALDLMRAHGIPGDEENWRRFRAGYAKRLPAALERCTGSVLPGVESLIAKLEALGDVKLGLLTGNLRETAEVKLAYYGLWRHFSFGGFGDIHTSRNDIATTAVEEAVKHHEAEGVDYDHFVVVIGDTQHDVTCAKSIGAKAVAVPTGHTPAETLRAAGPDLLVETLEDCNSLLDWFHA